AIVHSPGPPLVDCLDSWLAMLLPLAEVVLVDNAAPDAAIDEVAARFPAVRILRSESNLGYAGGATWGAQWVLEQHPQLAYLGVINDDVWIEAGALSRLVDALDARPEWGIVQPRLMLAEAPGHINTVGLD
ncbi:MAG: glycosyltransferase, partial [Planctomycetaceae bacterium]